MFQVFSSSNKSKIRHTFSDFRKQRNIMETSFKHSSKQLFSYYDSKKYRIKILM